MLMHFLLILDQVLVICLVMVNWSILLTTRSHDRSVLLLQVRISALTFMKDLLLNSKLQIRFGGQRNKRAFYFLLLNCLCFSRFKDHANFVNVARFSPNGENYITGSSNGKVNFISTSFTNVVITWRLKCYFEKLSVGLPCSLSCTTGKMVSLSRRLEIQLTKEEFMM